MTDPADREMRAAVGVVPMGLRRAVPRQASLTAEQEANRAAKVRFVERICKVLGDDESVRDLASFFGVKKSTLHERMRLARTDLAPLPEWFEKLDRYEEFTRLSDEFLRTA